ncbi:ABC transporter substrate-binding protein [Microbacterium sp.]|uniref:ABC transporter substrate-binding protein n=1 Tax=Microbacterium sp. TaxID=51671 RepID=UPI002626289D|nr:ABC transporter substrate-binding protein [Microbacterium sp.]
MRISRILGLGAAAVLAVSLAACAAPANSADSGDDTNPASDAGFPVTIEHAFGETTIDDKPERVASVAWANHEVPLALGIVPVIFEKATWGDDDGDGLLPWVADELDELGVSDPNLYDPTDGIDFEAVSDSQPDVILAPYSGLTQEDYDTLSKIAPVVAYPEVAWGASYEDMIELSSTALGLESEGDELIASLDDAAIAAAEAHPAIEGKTAMFASFDPSDLSSIGFYTSDDTRPAFLERYGMPYPELVSDAGDEGDEFYSTVSAEQVESFQDVDVIVTYAEESLLPTLQADALLSKIPAIAEGRVVFLGATGVLATASNPSPLSIPGTVEQYFAAIDEALADAE